MTADPKKIAGLTNVRRGDMHRVALRLRNATVTLSGWQDKGTWILTAAVRRRAVSPQAAQAYFS